MVGLFLVLATVVQQPDVRVQLDQDVVQVGDVVELRVVVEGADHDAVDLVEQPPFDGFTVSGMTRNSAVSYRGPDGIRTTTWRFELRAVSPGSFMLGPVRVRVGTREIESERVGIRVSAAGSVTDDGLAQRLRRIVEFAPGPDGTDQVIVSVVPSTDTLVVGDQLDLLVVAWFPRDVRTRLRTRPTLTPPELTGAWTYSQTAALGVLSSREVAGRMYDLFVHHQVVFPLTPGPFEVGSASVTYNLPLRTSILSREIPQEIQSRPLGVTILPPPGAANPDGAAARDFRLDVTLDTNRFAAGEAATLVATLSGRGNVALWPEPSIEWPPGLRVYPGQTDVQIAGDSGIVGGTKAFAYLLVADSVGTYNIPAASYAYFDLDANRTRTVTGPALRLVSRSDRSGTLQSEVTTRLMSSVGVAPAQRVFEVMPRWGWWGLVVVVPLLVTLGRLIAALGRRPATTRRRAGPQPENLATLHESFRVALRELVPDAGLREGDGLAAALTASGVEAPVALHAARVRDRLRHAAYGPNGGADQDELAAEVREVLNTLPRARTARMQVLRRTAVAGLVLGLMPAGVGRAQTPTAEQLFDAGSFRQAADQFAEAATAAPGDIAHLVNLGYALEAAGDPARARVAFLRAARLRPRAAPVRAALAASPGLDTVSRRITSVFLVTPFEALLVAAVLWLAGWGALALGARASRVAWVGVAAAVIGGYGWYVMERYAQPTALVVTPAGTVRTAPHGGAPPARLLNEATAVHIERTEGAWVFVTWGDLSGWMLAEEVAVI